MQSRVTQLTAIWPGYIDWDWNFASLTMMATGFHTDHLRRNIAIPQSTRTIQAESVILVECRHEFQRQHLRVKGLLLTGYHNAALPL